MPVDLPGFRKGDRTNIDLPHVQAEMLKALKKTGKPVIFVLCSGSTLALPWEAENLDAILEAWYPGQQGEQLWPMSCLATIILPDVYRLPSMLRAMISPILRTMT